MDVFGNSSYIPDQTGWPQTGFMPTANSFTPTNTTSTWSQTPPSNVPWGISYSQALPNVIRFTGQSDISFPHHTSISSPHPMFSVKRRLDESDEDLSDVTSSLSKPPPTKQFITEEKMAAKMNEMHISHAFVPHAQTCFPSSGSQLNAPFFSSRGSEHAITTSSSHNSPVIEDGNEESMVDENGAGNNNGAMPSLYLSEEVKQFNTSIEPLIPQAMLPRHINSKALVLWTPRLCATSNPDLWTERKHPSSPEASDDDSEFIRSDDPQCSVVITEIHEPRHRSEEEMAVDD